MEETSQQNQEVRHEVNHVRGVIEAILFVNEKPVTLEQIRKVLDTVALAEIKRVVHEIKDEFEARNNGVNVVEIAGGYQMLTNPLFASYVRDFYKTKHKEKLSKPALETLAIVAYKQPVSRTDIETIRGVNSDGIVVNLIEKELIKIVGRKDVPGRPFLYGTTKQFLDYFGLKSLDDLPRLEEFPDLVPSEVDESLILDVHDVGEQGGQAGEKFEAAQSIIQEDPENAAKPKKEQNES